MESIKRHNSYEIEFLLIVQQEGNAHITIEQHMYMYIQSIIKTLYSSVVLFAYDILHTY